MQSAARFEEKEEEPNLDDLAGELDITREHLDAIIKYTSQIENICAGAGGAPGYSYLTVLWRLAKIPGFSFNNIKRIAGTSIGSLVVLGIFFNLSPEEMFRKLSKIEFEKIPDSGAWWEWLLRCVTNKPGLTKPTFCKGDYLYEQIVEFLRDMISKDHPDFEFDPEKISFYDLKQLGYEKEMYIMTSIPYVINKEGHDIKKVWAYETEPHAPVAVVIRASAAVHRYFPGVVFKRNSLGHYEVIDDPEDPEGVLNRDGGSTDGNPFKIFDYEKYLSEKERKEHAENFEDKAFANFNRYKEQDEQHYSLEQLAEKAGHETYSAEMADYEVADPNFDPSKRLANNPHTLCIGLCRLHDTNKEPLRGLHPVLEVQALLNGLLERQLEDYLRSNSNKVILVPRTVPMTKFKANQEEKETALAVGDKAVADVFGLKPDDSYKQLLTREDEADENIKKSKLLDYPAARFLLWGNTVLPVDPDMKKPEKPKSLEMKM